MGKLVLITLGFLHPCPLLSGSLQHVLTFVYKKLLKLMTLMDLYKIGPVYFLLEETETAVVFNIICEVNYFIWIKCYLFYPCIQAM